MSAGALFGTGVGGRHRCRAGDGERILAVVGEFGDAEVEQLERAVVGDQHIRRFDVAVDDQMPVRVLHRAARLTEQLHARAHIERMRGAPSINTFAFDVFECKPRPAFAVHTAIEQGRDVAMFESRENPALHLESLYQHRVRAAA